MLLRKNDLTAGAQPVLNFAFIFMIGLFSSGGFRQWQNDVMCAAKARSSDTA
jgi:hypothetical protein